MIDPKTGKTVRNVMKEFRLMEISAVDRPAQAEAKFTIMKRDTKTLNAPGSADVSVGGGQLDDDERRRRDKQKQDRMDPEYSKALETAVTTQQDGHAHIIVGLEASREGLAERRSGMTSFANGHAHAWAMDDAGNILVADEEGHSHQIAAMMTKDLGPEETTAPGSESTDPVGTAEQLGDSGGDVMSDQNDKAADPAVPNEQIEQLTKRLEKAERFGQLTDAQKAHYNSLSETDQAEFLAKDADARDQILKNLADADPVVFTSEDGDVFRKSDDPRLVKQARQLDEERKRRKAMEEEAREQEARKRAEDLPFAGEIDGRVALVKALDALPEDQRAMAEKVLKANAERLELAQKTIGTAEADLAADPIEPIAKRLREQDSNLTPEQAYAKACQTPEGEAALIAQRSN